MPKPPHESALCNRPVTLVSQAYGALTFPAEPHHGRSGNGTRLTVQTALNSTLSSILATYDISHARIPNAKVLVQSLQTNCADRIKWK
ncbi:Protein kinase domain-containing protein [Psidium guajava]|nr:Protein kinase domain-containing protein [Psidium guajava]